MHVAAVAEAIFKFSSKHSATSRIVLLFLHCHSDITHVVTNKRNVIIMLVSLSYSITYIE
jgi:hypothetical protein